MNISTRNKLALPRSYTEAAKVRMILAFAGGRKVRTTVRRFTSDTPGQEDVFSLENVDHPLGKLIARGEFLRLIMESHAGLNPVIGGEI